MLGYLAIFGALGVMSRYGLDTLFATRQPWVTFSINLAGCFLAGLISATRVAPDLRTALLVGFCGGFTTFSAYAVQSLSLLQEGERVTAFVYFALSPALGLACAWLGSSLLR